MALYQVSYLYLYFYTEARPPSHSQRILSLQHFVIVQKITLLMTQLIACLRRKLLQFIRPLPSLNLIPNSSISVPIFKAQLTKMASE